MMQSVVKFLKDNSQVVGLVVLAIIAVALVMAAQKYVKKTEGLENVGTPVMLSPKLGDEFPVQSDQEIKPEDLLPKSQAAADFDTQFPIGSGDLASKNFLTAGHNIGINTVSSSLRNANLQLRSDPFIEPKMVSPFLNSTITPDMNRKNFEIGQ
jgi:hypothetical protein